LGLDTLYNASYSPHSSNLICTGGTDKNLSILDARILGKNSKSIVMSYSEAHDSAITDSKFNEFIPYWMASAGEDGVVKVFIYRHLKYRFGIFDFYLDLLLG
jgi:WD40 repeat protein